MAKTLKLNIADNSANNANKRSNINSNRSNLMKGMNPTMKTNITNGMAAERASRCENSTPASAMARRPMLNSSVRRPVSRPVNRTERRNPLLNSSVRPTSRRTSDVLGRAEWMKEIGMNCSRIECREVFGHSKDELVSGTARWDQNLERAYNDYYNEECNVNSARRSVRRPVLNSSARRPAMRRSISRPVLNSSARRPLANRPLLNSNRQSLRAMLEKAHASRLNSSLRPMPRRAKLNSSEEDVFDDADFDVADDTAIEETTVEETAADEGAVDVTELLIVQDPETKELSLFIQDDEDETLPESVEVIAAVEPATEADLDSSCGGKKKLNSSEEDGAEKATDDDADKADEKADDTETTEEEIEIELPDGETVEVDDIYVVQSEDGELDLFIAEEGAELPEEVEVVGEAVAVDESEVLDSSRKMIKKAGKALNSGKAGKKAGCARLNSGSNANKSYKELKSIYAWLLKNYPDASSAIGYDNIGYSEASYKKVGNKWSETGTENDKVDWEFYFNTMDAVPTFRNMGGKEKVEVKYTAVGKVPFKVTSINPDGTEKIVREFNFNDIKRIKDDSEKLDSSCDNKK